MKAKLPVVFLIAVCLHSPPMALRAHHATAAQFDTSKTINLKGVVSRLDWGNPHAHLHIDVKGDRGIAGRWNVELGSPGAIIVSGLSKELLSPGTTLTITGYPGRTNSTTSTTLSICATHVTLADGSVATFVVGV